MKQQEILHCLSEINTHMEKLHELLYEILDHPAKNYSIQFGNELFEFGSVFDALEAEEKAYKILRFLELLLIDEFTHYIKQPPIGIASQDLPKIFSRLFALAQGIDPKEMELEKVDLKDLYDVFDKDGNPIKAIALNHETYQVKNQLEIMNGSEVTH